VQSCCWCDYCSCQCSAQAESNTTPQFKLDIRNAPIEEEDGDANAAMASMVNTLRAVRAIHHASRLCPNTSLASSNTEACVYSTGSKRCSQFNLCPQSYCARTAKYRRDSSITICWIRIRIWFRCHSVSDARTHPFRAHAFRASRAARVASLQAAPPVTVV
jgi:hypothetical protein